MLQEGIKQSDGQLKALAVDDDGKLLVGGVTIDGDVTIGTEVEISNDVGNPVPVSGTVALGAGTAAIGKLAANSGVDIGDVDVTSLPAHLGTVASNTSVVGVELTRPANTDAYAAKDVVSDSTSAPTVLTFANFARVNQGSGIIVRARLMTDQKTCTAGFRLHLFHTAPTAINDNSPYLLLYANAANRIGMIDFPAMTSEDSTNSTAAATMRPSSDGSYGTPNLWYQAAAASRAIYGVLETTSAFTPASGQKFFIELAAIND